MRKFMVRSNSHESNYAIRGRDIRDAIVSNFNRIHADARFGNAAGYKLVKVTAHYEPGIIGGKGGCVLLVKHVGQDLAHKPASKEPQTTPVWIHCKPGDLPEPIKIV